MKAFAIPILTTSGYIDVIVVRMGIANAFIYFYSLTALERHLY